MGPMHIETPYISSVISGHMAPTYIETPYIYQLVIVYYFQIWNKKRTWHY